MRHKTFCRYCTANCGLVVETDGDEVISVRGDADDPVSAGYTCVKGRMLVAHRQSPSQLKVASLGRPPNRRTASTADVVDDLGRRLRAIMDEYGPDAVAVYRGNSAASDTLGRRGLLSLVAKIGSRSLYSALSIDAVSKSAVQSLMTGTGYLGLAPMFIDDECELLILFGHNPVVSHGSTWTRPGVRLREFKQRGELWVVDPRVTESARLASRHLALAPGSDFALAAYLVREILREGTDWDQVRAHSVDVDVLAAAVEPFTLAVAATRCGLPEKDLLDLLAAIRKAGRFTAFTGVGMTMSKSPCVSEWLLWALRVLTGSFEARGGAWFIPDFYAQYESKRYEPGVQTTPAPTRPDLQAWGGERPCAALADEIFAGNVRALVVVGGNPVIGFPDTDRITAALASLDVLAVAEIGATATTELATHVLPVTDQVERADLNLSTFRYTPAIVAPMGDRWPTWRVMSVLGQHLGVDVSPPGIDPATATDEEAIAAIARGGRVPLADPRDTGTTALADDPAAMAWAQTGGGWVENVLLDGRWQLAPPELVAQLRELYEAPVRETMLIPWRQPRHVNSKLVDVVPADGKSDRPFVLVHPDDAVRFELRPGAPATVTSAHGQLVVEVRLEEGIRPGTVSVPHGFDEPNVNVLTSAADNVDPLSGMPQYSGIAVQVRPLVP